MRRGALALGVVLIAACSSSSPAATPAATTAPTTSSAATSGVTTTSADTATGATDVTDDAVDSTDVLSTDTQPPFTATIPPTTADAGPPTWPLTGLPLDDPTTAQRSALVVKIDNSPPARPQTGFNEADIVFEEIVNDNLSRFAMVFHSHGSDPVGPIRSGRLQDIALFGSFQHPLFAWSGGNHTVTQAIRASDLVDIGPARVGVYFRTNDRAAPHNLYANTTQLWTKEPADARPPIPQFRYRDAGAAPAGTPSAGVKEKLDSVDSQWNWDAKKGLYLRTMEGKPHIDHANGAQVSADNVVVLVMEYAPGISGSPDAQTIGTGEAFVLTGGNLIHGTWSRDDRLKPFTLTADDGSPILLTRGRTFVELPRAGATTPL
jgi:hypothetical protein